MKEDELMELKEAIIKLNSQLSTPPKENIPIKHQVPTEIIEGFKAREQQLKSEV